MLALLIASWMTLPLYPLNPPDLDTLNSMNLHLSVGVESPNRIHEFGPNLGIDYELLIQHPYLVRLTFDYRYGRIKAGEYPAGQLHSTQYGTDFIYYRGANEKTAYIGFGAVLVKNFPVIDRDVADELLQSEGVTDYSMKWRFGYRITLGLRFSKLYSIEIGITEISPFLQTTRSLDNEVYAITTEQVRMNAIRLSIGYSIPLKM